jgi:hypothetical protein
MLSQLFGITIDKYTIGTIAVILALIYCLVWWLRTKGTPYGGIVLSAGISWAITIVTYYLGMNFDILPLVIICPIACIGFFIFVIMAWLAERNFKNRAKE